MTTIFVTVDFFLKDWYQNQAANPKGELWLCMQPHVRKGDLPQFLVDLGQTRKFSYTLVQTASAPNDLVPVPLPADANLTMRFLPANAALPALTNHRTTGVARKAEDSARQRLRDLNVAAHETSDRTADIDAGPFVPSYNKGLQAVWQQFQDEQQANPDRIALDRMAQMLGVAFWGGTPRVIPPSGFSGLDTVFLMTLPYPGLPPDAPPPTDTLTTNLHSLNGLLIRAGLREDGVVLATVVNLEIVFDDGQANPQVLATANSALAQATVTAFFKSLPNDIPQHVPTAVWNPNFARRVYVTHPLMPFVQQPSMQGYFRRRSEGAGTEAQPDPSGLRYLIARYSKDPTTAPPTSLSWNLFEAFDVTLRPYRDARTRPADGKVLLQLTPSAASRSQFYAELERQSAADPKWLEKAPSAGGPSFMGADGKPLNLTFVANGEFPWSEEPHTILYFGAAPIDNPSGSTHSSGSLGATLLVKRPDQIRTDWKGQDDPWGKRYESQVLPGGVSASFSILQLDPATPTGAAMDLVAGIAFAQQIQFEPAHSVSSLEGVLEVRYPNPRDLAAGDPVDVEQEFKHDLLNFNALNVFSSLGGGAPEALNPQTQLYPVFKSPAPVTIGGAPFLISYFHFRYPEPVTPSGSASTSAAFYESVYARMGQTRDLTFAIEHTYGTEIGSADMSLPDHGAPVASPADYPPALPNDVALTEAAEPSYTGPFSHFCSIEFDEASESATLHFATEWLSNGWDAKELYPIQSAAWRTVSELIHASKIELTGNFMRFRFQRGLDPAASTSAANTFAAGLEPVPGLEGWSQDITTLVRNECLTWPAHPPSGDPAINIVLALPAGMKLAGNCVVLNFALRVSRDATKLPPVLGGVDFVEPKPVVTTNEQGQLMRSIPVTEVGSLYEQWRTSLGQRTAPLEPHFASDATSQLAQLVSKLLSPDSVSGDAPGNWIAMSTAPVPVAQAVASACPFAFRPVKRDAVLGDNTFLVLTLYFWALDLVLRAAVLESANKDAAAWTQYFAAIQSQLDAVKGLILQLRDLVEPLPNSASNQLDPEVAAAVVGFQNDPSLRGTIQAWLTERFWTSPTLFGDAKAFLYTRLRNSDATSGAIDPFARLISPKQIHGTVGDPVWEEDRLMVWESLREAAVTGWFGFGEVLDELRYGDDYVFGDMRLSSLASLIAELAGNLGKDEIPSGPVHIPATPHGGVAPLVKLASRQPVAEPVCHLSMALNECQLRDNILKFSGKAISLDQLIQGEFVDPPVAGGRIATLVPQQTSSFDRGSEKDLFVLSALFSVRGDETGWPGAFRNDRFFIREFSKQNPLPLESPTKATTVDSSWLAKLADQLHPDQIPDLEKQVLNSSVIALVAHALQPLDPESDVTLSELVKQANLTVLPAGGGVGITVTAGAHPVEAYIFRTGSASAAGDLTYDNSSLLLLVNVLVPIWSPQALGMVQTRNLLPATASGSLLAPDFGRDFAEVSPLAAPQELHQPFETRDFSGDTARKLPRQKYSVTEIVQKLLLDGKILPTDNKDWNAQDNYLSVTVRAIQFAHSMSSWVDGGEVHDPGPDRSLFSSFVVYNYRFDPANQGQYTTPLEWFEPDTSVVDYYFDFQWSSGSNLQFFRVQNLEVNVT